MPRGPRLETPGALHHIIARGIERSTIFRHDTDRTDFLDRIRRLFPETGTILYAWGRSRLRLGCRGCRGRGNSGHSTHEGAASEPTFSD